MGENLKWPAVLYLFGRQKYKFIRSKGNLGLYAPPDLAPPDLEGRAVVMTYDEAIALARKKKS